MERLEDGITYDFGKEEALYDFDKSEMILRDFLAADRTLLANERTLLAYIRTGISLIAVGISLIKLFEGNFSYICAIVSFIVGIAAIAFGGYRYKKINGKMKNIRS